MPPGEKTAKDRFGDSPIVKEIINAHNQNIDVISTEGVGTEFIFTLEKAEAAPAPILLTPKYRNKGNKAVFITVFLTFSQMASLLCCLHLQDKYLSA